jgi:hypothetical protein
MAHSQTTTTEITAQSTKELFQAYDALSVDEKLALLYYVYEAMGESVTPAAPNAADIDLSQSVAGELVNRSESEQLEAMRSIVKGEDTAISRRYGGLTANNQLLVWYGWAQAMGNTVVDMPADYKAPAAINRVLEKIKGLDFQEQISLLREASTRMGYSEIGAPPSQAETGKTDSL